MLWLNLGKSSYQIVACNTHQTNKGVHELWVERPNGKTLKVYESTDEEAVNEVKDAIDFAIGHGAKTFTL